MTKSLFKQGKFLPIYQSKPDYQDLYVLMRYVSHFVSCLEQLPVSERAKYGIELKVALKLLNRSFVVLYKPTTKNPRLRVTKVGDGYQMTPEEGGFSFVPHGQYCFVRDIFGEVYACPLAGAVHPRLALGAMMVCFAGEVTFNHGQLVGFNNSSGAFTCPACVVEQNIGDFFSKNFFVCNIHESYKVFSLSIFDILEKRKIAWHKGVEESEAKQSLNESTQRLLEQIEKCETRLQALRFESEKIESFKSHSRRSSYSAEAAVPVLPQVTTDNGGAKLIRRCSSGLNVETLTRLGMFRRPSVIADALDSLFPTRLESKSRLQRFGSSDDSCISISVTSPEEVVLPENILEKDLDANQLMLLNWARSIADEMLAAEEYEKYSQMCIDAMGLEPAKIVPEREEACAIENQLRALVWATAVATVAEVPMHRVGI